MLYCSVKCARAAALKDYREREKKKWHDEEDDREQRHD